MSEYKYKHGLSIMRASRFLSGMIKSLSKCCVTAKG